VDNLERAIAASASNNDFESLRKGLELTYAQLKGLLSGEGLCPINCLGEKFDPNYHEAVMAVEAEGAESDSVVEEIQKGYTLGKKVIRPSKVVVSK
jgi:molecular chaperone GrpE